MVPPTAHFNILPCRHSYTDTKNPLWLVCTTYTPQPIPWTIAVLVMCVCVRVCVCTRVCVCVCVCVCVRVHTCVCSCACIYMCTCVFACMQACTCMCMSHYFLPQAATGISKRQPVTWFIRDAPEITLYRNKQ